MQEKEEFLRMLFDASPAFILAADAHGHVLRMNRSLLEALERAPDEVLERHFVDTFVPEAERPKLHEAMRQLAGGAKQIQCESRIVSKSGRERLAAWRSRPVIADDDRVKFYVAVGVDVTELREVERQFRHSQKMEAIGRLAGGVAHDFNNLLTVINGYSDLALRQIPPEVRAREHVREIRKAGERAASLTRQLLIMSKKQIVEPRPVEVGALVQNSHGMLKRLVGDDVELVLDLAPGASTVMVDPGQLDQVLLNLAVNARDAMPEGGRLTLRVGGARLTEAESEGAAGRYVVLEVSDTGQGMSQETQQKIFEPFFTTKGDAGTGLGLATVYGIVNQAGGWIRVKSESGMGTTFRIGLPVCDAALQDRTSRSEAATELEGHETVLVVDDDDAVRGLAVAALADFGYTVLQAASGQAAIETIREHTGPIDVVVTDLLMPGMNGRQLAERVRSIRSDIRVLVMTGYVSDPVLRRDLMAGVTEYIQKPFAPEALALRVRRLLGKAYKAREILLVDDDPEVRTFFAFVLRETGYKVTTRCDASGALETLAAGPFALVVTDLAMPNAEGMDLIREIRQKHPGLKVLAVSGAFGKGCLAAARSMGADAALQKPISPNHLVATVQDLIGEAPAAHKGHA